MAGKATAVLVEINGNLTPGSWLITPTSWLADCLEIGISSKFYHQLQVWDWLFLHLPYCHVCYYTFIGRCAGSFSSVGRRSMNSFTWSCANTSTSQKTSYAMHCMETTSVVCHIDDVIRCDLSVFTDFSRWSCQLMIFLPFDTIFCQTSVSDSTSLYC